MMATLSRFFRARQLFFWESFLYYCIFSIFRLLLTILVLPIDEIIPCTFSYKGNLQVYFYWFLGWGIFTESLLNLWKYQLLVFQTVWFFIKRRCKLMGTSKSAIILIENFEQKRRKKLMKTFTSNRSNSSLHAQN